MTEKTIPIQDDPKFSGLTLSKENEELINWFHDKTGGEGKKIVDTINIMQEDEFSVSDMQDYIDAFLLLAKHFQAISKGDQPAGKMPVNVKNSLDVIQKLQDRIFNKAYDLDNPKGADQSQ